MFHFYLAQPLYRIFIILYIVDVDLHVIKDRYLKFNNISVVNAYYQKSKIIR
jgi:hypothetical protein